MKLSTEDELGRSLDEGFSYPNIVADLSVSFTYASYQNAVPVVRAIAIENNGRQQFEGCSVELTSTPPFLRRKTWTIDRIIPGDRLPLTDRKVDLDAGYLAGLNEAERGEITLRLQRSNSLMPRTAPAHGWLQAGRQNLERLAAAARARLDEAIARARAHMAAAQTTVQA